MPPHGKEVLITELEAAILGTIGRFKPSISDEQTIKVLLELISKLKGTYYQES